MAEPHSRIVPEGRPPDGFAYVGCPDCGRVMTVPLDEDELEPWCIHHESKYSWRPPEAPETDWTQMVRVRVEV